MYNKICDDSKVIAAVQKYIRGIKNPIKRQYADDFWAAVYNESAGSVVTYPDTARYAIGYMAQQAVRMRITQIIQDYRTTY